MKLEELKQQLSNKYPDIKFDVTDKNFDKHTVFAFIPSRNLYLDVLNIYPCMWCEPLDEELHPEGDEMITFSDEYINEIMLQVDWINHTTDDLRNKIDNWMDYYGVPRDKLMNTNINYVVFWDENLEDAKLWFAMGCPDGQDYIREYSWIPEKDIIDFPLVKLTGKPANLSKIIKHFQFFEFYWRELALWYNNDPYRSHGKLQGFLYTNRYKYIEKLPDELTPAEILRGLTISGVVRGYTTFDAKLMYEVIDRYKPKSIYDPCAGWGERMLAAFCRGISYTGVDINPGLIDGYVNMMNYYNMVDCELLHGDSALYDLERDYDMVVTCPPYGDVEYYCDDGAENLSYNDFLAWWKDVVTKIAVRKPEHFCFQINTKYRDDMLKIVEDAGYKLVDELYFKSNKSSHFTRKKNGVNLKTEKESMLVLESV